MRKQTGVRSLPKFSTSSSQEGNSLHCQRQEYLAEFYALSGQEYLAEFYALSGQEYLAEFYALSETVISC